MTPEERRLRAAKIVGTIIGGPEYLEGDISYVDEELKRAMADERERCAKIAENEPEPSGPIPAKNLNATLEHPEESIRAAVRATRGNIATAIRKQE